METLKIGVVGFSRPQFDQEQGKKLLQKHILHLVEKFQVNKENVEIVSGLTNVGIPKLSYEVATEHEFVTVGISAKQALKVQCGTFPVDKQFIYGKKFGDESQEFIAYIDCLVRVGGGQQSRKEVDMFCEKLENDQEKLKDVLIEEEIEWLGN